MYKTMRRFCDHSTKTNEILNLFSAYVGGDEEGLRLRLVAGGIVAVVVLLVAIIVLTVLFLRSRSSDDCNKKQPSDCDTLEYRNGEGKNIITNLLLSTQISVYNSNGPLLVKFLFNHCLFHE